jgi:hypothetical protein
VRVISSAVIGGDPICDHSTPAAHIALPECAAVGIDRRMWPPVCSIASRRVCPRQRRDRLRGGSGDRRCVCRGCRGSSKPQRNRGEESYMCSGNRPVRAGASEVFSGAGRVVVLSPHFDDATLAAPRSAGIACRDRARHTQLALRGRPTRPQPADSLGRCRTTPLAPTHYRTKGPTCAYYSSPPR